MYDRWYILTNVHQTTQLGKVTHGKEVSPKKILIKVFKKKKNERWERELLDFSR